MDVRPEIKIENYKGIKVKPQNNKVTEEDLNKTLEFFKKGQGEKEVAIDPELLGKAYEKFNAIRPDNFEEYKKTLKIIKSTRITSVKGVILISAINLCLRVRWFIFS